MTVWTWADITARVEADLNLEGEDFITASELLGYGNEALDQAQQELMTIYEDYLLADTDLALVSGTATYSLPTDIYAHKIRAVLYDNGSNVYPVTRLKKITDIQGLEGKSISNSSTDEYFYIIMNEAGVGPRLRLIPQAQETSSDNIKMFYIREAARLTGDTSSLEIPESANFIIQYIKMRCYEKEGNPKLNKAIGDVEKEKTLMVETLTNMVPDEDNLVVPDLSFYRDFVGSDFC